MSNHSTAVLRRFLLQRRYGLLSSSSSSTWKRSASSTTTTTSNNNNNNNNNNSTTTSSGTNRITEDVSASAISHQTKSSSSAGKRDASATGQQLMHDHSTRTTSSTVRKTPTTPCSGQQGGPVRSNQPVVLTPGRLLETQHKKQQQKGQSSSPTSLDKNNKNNNAPAAAASAAGDVFSKWGKHRSATSNLTTLPILHASALLDPKSYCRQPNTTISGARAAQSLIQGRRNLLKTMQRELFDDETFSSSSLSSHLRRRRQAFVLQGHGVPKQLLQHLLDMANILLKQQHLHGFGTTASPTSEISFQNFHGQLDFEWMRIRSRSGTNYALPWSHMLHQLSGKLSALDMELYLTVMNRLACHLSLCLTPPAGETNVPYREQEQRTDNNPTSLFEEDDDDFTTTSATTTTTIPSRPNHWSVDMGRVWLYPPPLLNHHGNNAMSSTTLLDPTLIVEWTPRQGLAAPGHVCIRLQGYASSNHPADAAEVTTTTRTTRRKRRPKRLPVSMVFDSCFRYL